MYEGPKEIADVGDWRYQEMLQLSPYEVMDELLSLSNAILDARTEYNEAAAELWLAQERLKLMEAQVLQTALDSEDNAVIGRNAEERKRKADIYLAAHSSVLELRTEVDVLQVSCAEKQVAMDALVDRQKNLHGWARMYSATVRLLATVRVVGAVELEEPLVTIEELKAGQAALERAVDRLLDLDIAGESEQDVHDANEASVQTATPAPVYYTDDVADAVERYQDDGDAVL